MNIFNLADNNNQRAANADAWLSSHGLDTMKPEYKEMLKPLASIEESLEMDTISGARAEALSKDYLQIIKEQNWVIIRLLSEIANK
ncbi:MAG: hypothetical protein Q4E57_05190 [Eubacteriales bacterium]|nr:hypothetical protein [Eubacteriales bacterium]